MTNNININKIMIYKKSITINNNKMKKHNYFSYQKY